MDIKDFIAGTYGRGYEYKFFLPAKVNHSFFWSEPVIGELLEKASLKLGELNSFSLLVPDVDRFILIHIFKEAVVSSRIEGTQTNIEEALTDKLEIQPEKRDDWTEVNNYVQAMNQATEELKTLPLSNRLIKNTHRILLSSVRGEHKNPGEFRKSQNWIGGANLSDAIFIPPIHTELPELLSDLEHFLHNTELKIPHLIRIAIAHYQFETIHPFLDGNGRIGRLLITLYLVANNVMEKPLLYLSTYFDKHKSLYYDNLTRVRTHNDLSRWIRFFLNGIIETAEESVQTLKKIMDLKASLEKDFILKLGKRSDVAMTFFLQLFKKPVVTVKDVEAITGLSAKASNDLVRIFLEKGILVESTGGRRHRIFVFKQYTQLF